MSYDIVQLEQAHQRILDLERQNSDLQAHNNQLLQKLRLQAERIDKEVRQNAKLAVRFVHGRLSFDMLREANRDRDREWDSSSQITPMFRALELAGEVGETMNVVKKIERETMGLKGSRASRRDLESELADVVICADLLAMVYGIDLEPAIVYKFNETSVKHKFQTRLL